MPTFEDHCNKCQEELGETFSEVHLWLDYFFGKPPGPVTDIYGIINKVSNR